MRVHFLPKVYRLSDLGRQMLWSEYESYGYSLSLLSEWRLSMELGPIAHWSPELTLGRIEDIDPAAGREIARNFVDILDMPELTVLRERFENLQTSLDF